MIIKESELKDVFLLEPRVWGDDRGYFFESYREDLISQNIRKFDWVQDNESMSSKGVLRGLHYQLPPFSQSKLVRVIMGSVLDVAVDIRKGSPNFGKHIAIELSAENKKQMLIPRGFAHGFLVLTDHTIFSYKVDHYYSKETERSLLWNDPALHIDWKMPEKSLILSDKDKIAKPLSEIDSFSYVDLYA